MAVSVARLCQILHVKQVADYYNLSWGTVKNIGKTTLEEELSAPDLSGVTQIVMDEFAIPKGHRYATVIVGPYTKRVLWLGEAAVEKTFGRSLNCSAKMAVNSWTPQPWS